MASPKTGQSKKPSTPTRQALKPKQAIKPSYVVVITNVSLTQVVCGPFSNARAAEKYAEKLNNMQAPFQAVAAPITPRKVVDDYLKAGT